MDFERGKEITESLELGVKKDAIKIHKIHYWIDGEKKIISNPGKMRVFIQRLTSGDLPKDPIFGIEAIALISIKKSIGQEIKQQDSFRSGFTPMPTLEYKIVDHEENLLLTGVLGKIISIRGKFLKMPTSDDLKETGFGYLEEFERSISEPYKDEEEEELLKKLHEKQREQMITRQAIWERESPLSDIRSRKIPEDEKEDTKKGDSKKQKKRWLKF